MKRRFVDTNVLIYSLGTDPNDTPKSDIAVELLLKEDWAISVQVLQEFYTQSIRPSRPGHVSRARALEFVERFCEFPVQPMTLDIFYASLATCHRYQISYWDAAIIEAARALGCDTILTEDLQDGQDFGGLRVINPFRS